MTLLLLSLACGTGSVALGPDDGTNGENNSDTGLTEDTGEEVEEPTGNAAEGSWDGDIEFVIPEWDWDLCTGELELDVDEDGVLTGDGDCTKDSDWGEYSYPMEFTGEVDDDGEITGSAEVEIETRDGYEYIEADLSGEVEGDDMIIELRGELPFGGGGGGGSPEFEGYGEASR
ncbi:MAG: hypothetical protein GY913_35825 [Proteobacteria bacterium]|nr:hypothetical protein [Pseudomonadota bacterium]MCP4922302.1 hypothetical protein [Pseudomonadota bacterium]